jgi:peroxiredoxin Q/BCP
LGVSVDDIESHKQFSEKYNLNFNLLADVDKKVCKAYGTLSFIGFSKRHTFIIDKAGFIRKIYRDVNIEQHTEEIAAFIRKNLK